MVDIYGGTSTGGLANLNNTLVRLAGQNRQAPYEAERLNAMKRTGEMAGMNLDQEKIKQQGLMQARNMQPLPNETPEQRLMRQRKILMDTGNYDASTHLQGLADQEKKDRAYVGGRLLAIHKEAKGNENLFKQIAYQEFPDKKQFIDALKIGDNVITAVVRDQDGNVISSKKVYESGNTEEVQHTKPKERWGKPYESKLGGKSILLKTNLDTGETVQVSQDTGSSGINSILPEDQLIGAADSIAQGKMDPIAFLSKRGTQLYAIQQAIRDKYPNFNFNQANANYKYMTNPTNLVAIGRVEAAMPRVEDLKSKINKLNNIAGIPLLDKPLNSIRRSVGGNEAIVDFESLRNAILTEVNTALSGSSVASDYRIKLELENLGSDRTPRQLYTAINNLKSALEARTDASKAVPYDWDKIRGESKQNTQQPISEPSKKSRFIVEEVK
jgi:hypothetical protein